MRRAVQRRTMVVELVGPPGAGKSTLARVLGERDRAIRPGMGVVGLPRALLLRHAVRLLPRLLGLVVRARTLPWSEARQMIRLSALHAQLVRAVRRGDRMLLLEEGPVLVFGWLRVNRPAMFASRPFASWRREALRQWAELLDAVVILDAADPILARRIRTRAKPHAVKHRTDPEISAFIGAFRSAFDQVLGELGDGVQPRAIPIDTGADPEYRIADRILSAVARAEAVR